MALAASLVTAAFADTVTVTIHRVRQLDDLDKSTPMITKDRADFYCQIWVNGRQWTSQNFSADDGRPYWTFSVPVSSRYADIRIKLLDDDGNLERKDDYVDINRKRSRKDLLMRYDRQRGRISGDVTGRKGAMLTSTGMHDSSQGQIWFTVS